MAETSDNGLGTQEKSEIKFSEKFAHLHLHTTYSLLDGAIRINELMQHCKSNGMDSVAMTDHGNMFGAIQFYKEAVKTGIKPIIGCEFYVAPGGRKEERHEEKLADGNNYHLILLAQNRTGYANIIKLCSRSYTEGYYYKPRIDYDLLSQHSEGIICLTACLAGEVQRKTVSGKQQEAQALAGKLSDIFGKEKFYLEIQNHGIPEEHLAALGNVEIAKRLGIPLALTNDSHFLMKDDREAQDILLRINQKKNIDDELRFGFNPEFHVKTPREMMGLFPELPEAFHNTQRIAEMVALDFSFGNPLLPKFDVPRGYTLDTFLRELAWNGILKRYGANPSKEVIERFDFELNVITKMDFSGYFLIVQDFINHAKGVGIPVGPGRGSAAGSIIAYSLGITDIEPLRYGLLFERFLNPDRKEMPDIDVDFCTDRREEVINYVRDKYGRDHVGQIITYNQMAAKACLKDVARVLKLPFDEANQISKKFPDVLGITIEDALKQSGNLKSYSTTSETHKRLFQVALKLEGNVRHAGVHAAGVVIAPQPLEEIVPLATVVDRSDSEKSNGRVLVSQYDMKALTDVGLVKMDFLGLRNLTVIDSAIREIKERTGTTVDLANLPLDDVNTYKLLQSGQVRGVFQLETSPGMREFVIRMQPNSFTDVIALIALFRPGPLQSGMADSYINRKKKKEKVAYPHSDLESVLGDTYGVIVYQEQVMQISRIIGGFTAGESDGLRKAMGKKIKDKMAELRVKFVEGAKTKQYNPKMAEELYDQMAKFAEYGFNKSHSAAYAMVVYQTAYLKANFPTSYMRAVLDSEKDKTAELIPYLNACQEMDIKILGPDINESLSAFRVVKEGVIRFGLSAIKNVGQNAVESILKVRDELGGFKSFTEFVENIDLHLNNKRTLEALILAGALDSLGYKRRALMEGLDVTISRAQKTKEDKLNGQTNLFDMMTTDSPTAEIIPRGDGVIDFQEAELLRHEKELLGIYLSGHPLAKFERSLRNAKVFTIESLKQKRSGDKVEIAAVLTDFKRKMTKMKKEMIRLEIEDMTGGANGVIFPNSLAKLEVPLEKENAYLFRCTLELNEETGTPSLLVDDVKFLNSELIEEKLEKSLHLKIDANQLANGDIDNIKTILKGFAGNLAVYFHLNQLQGSPNVIKAHDIYRVQMSQEMVSRLRNVKQINGIYLFIGDHYRELYAAE